MVKIDPRFYVRHAAWYGDNGDVRYHKELFIVALVLSEFPGHRDVGLALVRELPPYQVARVVDFIHGRKRTRLRAAPDQPPLRINHELKKELQKLTKTKRRLRLKEIARAQRKYDSVVEEFGL